MVQKEGLLAKNVLLVGDDWKATMCILEGEQAFFSSWWKKPSPGRYFLMNTIMMECACSWYTGKKLVLDGGKARTCTLEQACSWWWKSQDLCPGTSLFLMVEKPWLVPWNKLVLCGKTRTCTLEQACSWWWKNQDLYPGTSLFLMVEKPGLVSWNKLVLDGGKARTCTLEQACSWWWKNQDLYTGTSLFLGVS